MGYSCKLVIDGEEKTFEYDSDVLNKIIAVYRGHEIKIDKDKMVISISQFNSCCECEKVLLVSVEVNTLEDKTKHFCEYCIGKKNLKGVD